MKEILVKKKTPNKICHYKTDRAFFFYENFTFKVSKRFQARLWRISGSLFDLFQEKVYGCLTDQSRLEKGRGINPLSKWQKRSKHIQKRK